MAYALTRSGSYKKELVRAARPELDKLTQTWNENSLLAIIEENTRVILASSDGSNNVQANTHDHKKAYHTAVGRVLISKLSVEDLNKFITKYGRPTQEEWPEVRGSEKSLKQQLAKINDQGYAVILNNEEVIGFAVPIIHNGVAVAGIGIYMPAFRFKKSQQKKIIQSLILTAEAIANKL